MDEAVGLLQKLGFGEYEAKAYAALLQRSPVNGYELSKQSGIPRANIYSVLGKLEERGAVLRVESGDAVRYAPVPPEELTRRLSARFQETLQVAERSLSEMAAPAEQEHIWSMQGYNTLLEHAATLVEGARQHILVAIWPEEARHLAGVLSRAEARGVAITSLCLAACSTECGGCRGHLYRYRVAPEYRNRWLLLIPDSAAMLAGEITADGAALGVRTRQRLLIDLAGWYIRHSIVLAAVLADLGPRLGDSLSPQTHAILATLGPPGVGVGWLEHMRHLLTAADGDAVSVE